MHLANLKRVLTAIFIAVAVFLSACGGGGGSSGGAVGGGSGGDGSGDSGGSGGGSEPVAYRAAEPVVAMDSLVHFSVSGLEGNLLIADADGSEYQVLSDGVTSADYYSVGSRPQFRVSVQPVNQHCEIDAGTLYAVPSHDDFIQISCLPLLMADPSATYLPGQMVFFGLTVEGLLTGEVQGLIDDVYPVDALVWNGILGLMMPIDMAAGAHTLELTIGGRDITHAFELTAPLEMGDAETYIIGELDRIQGGLEALLPTADTQGQAAIQGVLSAISQMRDILPTLSPEELLDAAYFLAANNPSNAPVAEPAVSLARVGHASKSLLLAGVSAKSTFDEELCLEKAKLFAVEKNAIAFLVGVGAAGLGATDILLTMSAGAGLSLGAALPALLAITAGGAIVYRALEASLESALTAMLDECINWQAILEWFGLSGTFSERSLMLSAKSTVTAKSSSLIGESIKHISLVHGEEKSIHLWAKRTVPPAVESLIRKAQQELMPVSGIFDEILDPLYLFEFTKVLPVDDGSVSIGAFQTSGYAITRNYSQSGNIVDLTFEFYGDEYPENPQAFSMTFLATVTDGVEAPEAVDLSVRGSLLGGVPIAYNDYFLAFPGEVLEGELKADYATSFAILNYPEEGEFSFDEMTGRFSYFPSVDSDGEELVTFIASNSYGVSEIGTVVIRLSDACISYPSSLIGSLPSDYDIRCEYKDEGGSSISSIQRMAENHDPSSGERLYEYDVRFDQTFPDGVRVQNRSYRYAFYRGEDDLVTVLDEWKIVSFPDGGYYELSGSSFTSSQHWNQGISTYHIRYPSVWNGVEGAMHEYLAGCDLAGREFASQTLYEVSDHGCVPGDVSSISPFDAIEHIKAGVKKLMEIQDNDPYLRGFGAAIGVRG